MKRLHISQAADGLKAIVQLLADHKIGYTFVRPGTNFKIWESNPAIFKLHRISAVKRAFITNILLGKGYTKVGEFPKDFEVHYKSRDGSILVKMSIIG